MAIEFARSNIIGRSKGHSAVKAAAYRSGTDMMDEQIGQSVSYSHRADEVAHSEILLPGNAPAHLSDRETLWQAIEEAENRSTRRADAQLAVDHIIALPRELSLANQIALAREFALSEFVVFGVAVDLNVHLHSKQNPHAHLMATTRVIDGDGVGLKARVLNGRFVSGRKQVDEHQLRHRWAQFQNEWGRRNGIDLLVTNNNGEWAAQIHQGPRRAIPLESNRIPPLSRGFRDEKSLRPDQKGVEVSSVANPIAPRAYALGEELKLQSDEAGSPTREQYNRQVQDEREASLASDPTEAIRRVARMKSVFSRHDIYRELARHISDRESYVNAKTRVDTCSILVRLTKPGPLGEWFTTTEVLETEQHIAYACRTMAKENGALALQSSSVSGLIDKHFPFLSEEQQQAVFYVTSGRRLAAIVGLAGTGKSTTLQTANEAWVGAGAHVRGLALAGKAAHSLEEASGIVSRTIHSFLYAHRTGREAVTAKDVFVLDEAGMVNAELMASLLSIVNGAGATLVVVGDQDQLQPIQAGNPFRSIARNLGYLELATIRRQRHAWARQATYLFARHKTREALELLHEHRCFRKAPDRDSAVVRIVSDYVSDFATGQLSSQSIVLAHANREVISINRQIRQALVERGLVKAGSTINVAGERSVQFGEGDRVLFKRNDLRLGVRNGSLGTASSVFPGSLVVRLDDGSRVFVDVARYNDLDLGYAMTVHKAQGVTVDKTRVLVTPLWDRHLSYVALSRHRESVEVYFGDEEFRGLNPLTGQHRPGLTDAMSRDASKVSALDFAEQHGLAIRDQRAVELPDDELRRRAEQAKDMLRGLLEVRVEHTTRGFASQISDAQEHLRTVKVAVQRQRTVRPRGLLSLFSQRRWEREYKRLGQAADASADRLRRLQGTGLGALGSPDALRQAVRADLVRQYPREAEAIQAWQDRQSVRQASNKHRQEMSQEGEENLSHRSKGRSA